MRWLRWACCGYRRRLPDLSNGHVLGSSSSCTGPLCLLSIALFFVAGWPLAEGEARRLAELGISLLLVATKAAVRHRAALRWCLSEARPKAQKKIDADNAEGHRQFEEIARRFGRKFAGIYSHVGGRRPSCPS